MCGFCAASFLEATGLLEAAGLETATSPLAPPHNRSLSTQPFAVHTTVRRMTVRRLALWLCVATLLAGCRTEEAPERYAARVGDMYLTQSELDASLRDLAGLDTIEARRQIIEQWVTRTLLLQEALALNL
jgi:hypothetical protein